MTKVTLQKLKTYKKKVKERIEIICSILQKVATGDFTVKVEIPKKEDEFTELLAALSIMIDDLRESELIRRTVEEEKGEKLKELEHWHEMTIGREIKMAALKEKNKELEGKIEDLKKILPQ